MSCGLVQEATIAFAKVVDFNGLTADMAAMDVVNLLNHIYSTFDDIINRHGIYKVALPPAAASTGQGKVGAAGGNDRGVLHDQLRRPLRHALSRRFVLLLLPCSLCEST